MSATGYDINNAILLIINNSVGIVDVPVPISAQVLFEWLRFTNSFKRTSVYVFYQCIDPL